jgi:hypothetical protein
VKRLVCVLAALSLTACSDSGTAPTTNVVSAGEKAAVQQALQLSFGNDSLYTTLSGFVLPFIDQATPQANASGDTTKLAGFQLDVVAGSISAGVSGLLAWRGYRPASGTVDTVFLVVGAGLTPPLSDSLSETFAVNLLGSGTAWVIAEAADSSIQTWKARTGAIRVDDASYGAGTTADLGGGFTISRARGWMAGGTHLMAKLVPDSTTSVTANLDFTNMVESVKLTVTGTGT